jgi:hypothetical protein
MDNDKDSSAQAGHNTQKEKGVKKTDMSNAIYGIGFIGALVYFIQHAVTFWAGLLGIFKTIFWPALLVYKALEMLRM